MLAFDLGDLSTWISTTRHRHSPPWMRTRPAWRWPDRRLNPLETKLSLAEEFRAIGDLEGARSLAEEVLAEASGFRSRPRPVLSWPNWPDRPDDRALVCPDAARRQRHRACDHRCASTMPPTHGAGGELQGPRLRRLAKPAQWQHVQDKLERRWPSSPRLRQHPVRRPYRRRGARPDAGGAFRLPAEAPGQLPGCGAPTRFLPPDIAVQWAREVPPGFHARASATARRYAYVLLESPVRPSVDNGQVGWVFRPLDQAAMQQAADSLLGEHDFTSFRASACQAHSPVKDMRRIDHRPPRRLLALRIRGLGLPAPHDPQHHGLPGGHRHRQPYASVDGRVCWPPKAAMPLPPPFSPGWAVLPRPPVYDTSWNLPDRTPAFDWLP